MGRTRERPNLIETAYRSPDGGKRGIWFAILEYWMLYLGSGYWNANPRIGDALLTQTVDSKQRTLSLVFKEPLGYLLKYQGLDDETPWIALNPNEVAGSTQVTIGGVEIDVPVKYFLDRELAAEIVRKFLASGIRSQRVQWAELPFEWPKPLVEFE